MFRPNCKGADVITNLYVMIVILAVVLCVCLFVVLLLFSDVT